MFYDVSDSKLFSIKVIMSLVLPIRRVLQTGGVQDLVDAFIMVIQFPTNG